MQKILAILTSRFVMLSVLVARSLKNLAFWSRKSGADRFLHAYRSDTVLAVTESERNHWNRFGACVSCSACTLSCRAIQTGLAPGSFEPKQLVLSFGRDSRDAETYLEEWLPCLACQSCTVVCPTNVPLHRMAREITNRRNRIRFRTLQATSGIE